MFPTAHFALLALAIQQSPAPPATVETKWRDLDRVVAIVNQDIITLRELSREIAAKRREREIKNDSELQALQDETLTTSVNTRLSIQAGQDLGADEKIVDHEVQEQVDRLIEKSNGVVGLSKFLAEKDMSVPELKRYYRERLYSNVWEESITGEGTGVSTRKTHDRFVRPGALLFEYRIALSDPVALKAMGGSKDTYTLQSLVLDPAANGGEEKTLALAQDLSRRIREGEDMAELVRHYSITKTNDGVADPAELVQLQRIQPALAKFASESKAGDVSAPLPFQTKSGPLVRIVRLVEHTPGVTPDLASATVQSVVERIVVGDMDHYRLDRAYDQLYKAAYIWPDQFAARKPR